MTDENSEAKNIVEVPVRDLLRVTPFQGHDDMRYYLNGVLVTPYEDHALLVATNGHWLGVYESKEARTDAPRILDLPKWFVNQIEISKRGDRHDGERNDWDDEEGTSQSFTAKTLTVATPTSHMVIRDSATEILVKPGLPFIDGKFPDWQKVIPDSSKLERGLFSPFAVNYFGGLHRAVPNDREYPIFCYQNRDNLGGPGVFRFGGLPEFVVVLMPRRDTDKGEMAWPTWMPAEKIEAAA
jgi:hypothetical protein